MKLRFAICLALAYGLSLNTARCDQPKTPTMPKAAPAPASTGSSQDGPDTVEVNLQIWQVFGDERRALKEAGFRQSGGLLRLGGGDERKHNGVPYTVERQLQLLGKSAEILTGVTGPSLRVPLGRVTGLKMGLGVNVNQLCYLVRTGEKTFELEQLPADVRNALGLTIDLTPRAVPSDAGLINISPLKITFTTVDAREPIPGVDLEIGKPIISTRALETSFTLVDGGDAIGIVMPGPEGRQPILFITVHRVATARSADVSPAPQAKGAPSKEQK
jgi:hypothetical protein